jgi:hypothetical protein
MSGVYMKPGPGCPGWYASAAPEATNNPATGKGSLAHLGVENKNAAVQYVFAFDGLDATGTIIAGPIAVPSHGSLAQNFPYGVKFTRGLFVGLSTSDTAYSVGGTDAWFNVGWNAE